MKVRPDETEAQRAAKDSVRKAGDEFVVEAETEEANAN
jgi:hypothetical protein